ncbi:MAG: hypothetical protein Q7J27_07095 [Syntrophales bacterium]|nr:hypothetical protein [Syntrophales bacterium]
MHFTDTARLFCRGYGDDNIIGVLNKLWQISFDKRLGKGLYSLANNTLGAFWEGDLFGGIWSQNYIGMYCWTPLMPDALFTYHVNSYRRLFDAQSDGATKDYRGEAVPAGALPEYINYRKEIGGVARYKVDEYIAETVPYEDFWVEGTAAMVYCFGELILTTRDRQLLNQYLSRLESACEWLHSRVDENGLLAVGPAGTLIEREYGATYLGNLKYERGYPAGAMVWYIAANRQVAELEKMGGRPEMFERFSSYAKSALESLPQLFTRDGYLVNYMDWHGNPHGVVGAKQHGYFESNPNHDALALEVVNRQDAEKIYMVMKSADGLFNQYGQVRCVHPVHDDCMPNHAHGINPQPNPDVGPRNDGASLMHEHGPGEHWNGGIWFCSQTRMLMAQYMLGKHRDILKPLERHLELYREGMLHDQIKGDGETTPYSKNSKHVMLDFFEVPGAGLRGLFEYRYLWDRLLIYPHMDPTIEQYEQIQPVRYGTKKIHLKVDNKDRGYVKKAVLNGETLKEVNDLNVQIKYDRLEHVENLLEIEI